MSRLILALVCLGFVFLYMEGGMSGSQPEQKSDTHVSVSTKDHAVADKKDIAAMPDVSENKEMMKTEAELSLEKLQETMQDKALELELLTNFTKSSPIHDVYKDLVGNYAQRRARAVTIDDVLPKDGGISRTFVINVVDTKTQEPVVGASVFLRGALLGRTNDNGVLEMTKNIPRSHDLMVFEVMKPGYIRGFERINEMYYNGSKIVLDIDLLGVTRTLVKTNAQDIQVTTDDVTLELTDPCALRSPDGECYVGEVFVESAYIHPDEVDLISLPMEAIVNGEIKHLLSNGMALTDFYDDLGNQLIYNGKQARSCYVVGQEQIDAWNTRINRGESQEGYRWFNRSIGYWEFDADAVITIENGEFCVETTHIY